MIFSDVGLAVKNDQRCFLSPQSFDITTSCLKMLKKIERKDYFVMVALNTHFFGTTQSRDQRLTAIDCKFVFLQEANFDMAELICRPLPSHVAW